MMQQSIPNTANETVGKLVPVAPNPPISKISSASHVSKPIDQTDGKDLSVPEFLPMLGDLDLRSTELLLESAQSSLSRRNHKEAAQLLERALPSVDRFYAENEGAKLKALRMLRDCYLALGRGVEAQDCAEVALSVFEDIMSKKLIDKSSIIGNPAAFTRPVVRKLRTLRRARESEYLRRRAVDISDRWDNFMKLP